MNVSDDQLRAYIDTFLSTLESEKDLLPKDARQKLLHLSLLPARIVGYVSNQFGLAIEFFPATTTHIEVVRGDSRIEDLFLQSPRRRIGTEPVIRFTGPGSGVRDLTIDDDKAYPFRLDTLSAEVKFSEVGFKVGSWNRVVKYAEVYGDRSEYRWTVDKATIRAKDQLLAALVELERSRARGISIEEYIKHFKQSTVLLLGDYGEEGIKRLETIQAILSSKGYEVILVKDIPDHPYQDIPQKIVAVGAVARFVLVDDSSRSGHLVEVQICKQNSWVTVLLRSGGKGGSWMTAGASHASNVILEKAYDPSAPETAINEAITWAEEKLVELEKDFKDTYPWRQDTEPVGNKSRY